MQRLDYFTLRDVHLTETSHEVAVCPQGLRSVLLVQMHIASAMSPNRRHPAHLGFCPGWSGSLLSSPPPPLPPDPPSLPEPLPLPEDGSVAPFFGTWKSGFSSVVFPPLHVEPLSACCSLHISSQGISLESAVGDSKIVTMWLHPCISSSVGSCNMHSISVGISLDSAV